METVKLYFNVEDITPDLLDRAINLDPKYVHFAQRVIDKNVTSQI